MEIYKIIYFKCDTDEKKKFLLRKTKEVLNFEGKLDKDKLWKICRKLENKYKHNIIYIKKINNIYITSIKGFNGYNMYESLSEYEALLKYVLLIREKVKYKNKLEKDR